MATRSSPAPFPGRFRHQAIEYRHGLRALRRARHSASRVRDEWPAVARIHPAGTGDRRRHHCHPRGAEPSRALEAARPRAAHSLHEQSDQSLRRRRISTCRINGMWPQIPVGDARQPAGRICRSLDRCARPFRHHTRNLDLPDDPKPAQQSRLFHCRTPRGSITSLRPSTTNPARPTNGRASRGLSSAATCMATATSSSSPTAASAI